MVYFYFGIVISWVKCIPDKRLECIKKTTIRKFRILAEKKLEEMFSSPNRETFAEGLLIPLVEKQVKKRPHIQLPDDGMMRNVLQEVLEEIADASGIQPLAV